MERRENLHSHKKTPPPPMHTHTLSARQKWGHRPPTLSHRQKNITLLLRSPLLWEMMGGKLHNRLGS